MSRPTISVVIPTHNRADLIGDAIRSVRAQGVQPLEIIVVDDGSTDETEQALKGMSVRYIRQKNAGSGAARNNGINASSGEWIAFLDSDDLWPGDRLAAQLALLEANQDLDFIFGKEAKFSAGTEAVVVNDGDAHETGPIEDAFKDMIHNIAIPTSGVLVRRSVLLEVNAFDPSLRVCQDTDLWMRLALGGYNFGFVNCVSALRRMHSGNIVNDRVRMKEAAIVVLTRYVDARQDLLGEAHLKLSNLHYDLGSAYLKLRQWRKAKVHLSKVQKATGRRRVMLSAKMAVLAFVP